MTTTTYDVYMAWILDDAAGAGRCRHAWTWTWTRSQPDPRPDPVVHRAPCRRTVRDASWEHQAASENESFRLLRAFALVVPAMLPRRTKLKQSMHNQNNCQLIKEIQDINKISYKHIMYQKGY
jgi:hypothetical protein